MEYLKRAERIAYMMDEQFSIFGYRFGLDTLIGFIPGLGDIITTAFALYILWIGQQMKLPRIVLIRMALNIAIDFGVGAIPVLGDIGDWLFKANSRNLRILKKYSQASN